MKVVIFLVLLVAAHAAPTNPAIAETKPCCQGKCTVVGEEKYWSIAKGILGKTHCGECCMDPSKYNLYHFFEKNLTKSQSDSPCNGFGFTKYDSTVTHGFGPVKMTLDLYDEPSTVTSSAPELFNRVYHHVDKTDNQCFQAEFPASCFFTKCAPMAGVESLGECPDQYNVKKTKTVQKVCRDGGNIKYCDSINKIEVTVTTYGVGTGEDRFVASTPLVGNSTTQQCTSDSDCPCSYCMNDSSKHPPYICHANLPGVCCTTDKDCPGSYCVNYHGPPPYHCHA